MAVMTCAPPSPAPNTRSRGEMRGMSPRLYAADLLGIMGAAGLMLAAASIA